MYCSAVSCCILPQTGLSGLLCGCLRINSGFFSRPAILVYTISCNSFWLYPNNAAIWNKTTFTSANSSIISCVPGLISFISLCVFPCLNIFQTLQTIRCIPRLIFPIFFLYSCRKVYPSFQTISFRQRSIRRYWRLFLQN